MSLSRFLLSRPLLRSYLRGRVLRQLALYLALMLPVVWGLVMLEQKRFAALDEAAARGNRTNLSRAFAEEVRATIGIVDLSLVQLRGTWRRDPEGFAAGVAEHARHLRDRVPMHIVVTDAKGRLLYTNAGAAPPLLPMGDLAAFHAQIAGSGDSLYVSRPSRCRITGAWIVQFTRPIRDAQGRLLGVIGASVAPDYFLRFYDSIDLGPNAAISLVRSDGAIIGRSTRQGGNRDMGRVVPDMPYNAPGAAVSGHFHVLSRLDGIERDHAWRKLPEYGLTVTAAEAVPDAMARNAQQRAMLHWSGVAVSLVLAALGWAAIGAADRRRRALKALGAAEARWKLALNAAGDGVWDCDLRTGEAKLSPRAQLILDAEHPVITWYGGMLEHIVHPDDLPAVRAALRAHFDSRTKDYAAEHRVRLRSGEWRWIDARGTVTERAEDGKPLRMVGTFSSIDARKHEEARMRRMAHQDALTGLPNRVLFGERLRQAIAAADRDGHRVAVVYFDLDKFKPVNDTWGHAAGDRLLRMVAQRVRAALRESDLLARIGGDEFAVLLPHCDTPGGAEQVARTILARLEEPFEDGERVLRISGSLGYALYPDCGGDAEALMRCADLAMYDAKAHGRNRVSGSYRTKVE
ncbi:diguanylate cyclase domain-containing protein [Massilia sp. ST3]|uniref:sensor domain-containing diguanylate cyclase n=1 Tax=Massilia sp. ST3 TaxID=2824903 RepID=UPI001B81AD77|nr:diguanylate cyclase [Massilia sp. ST3]MBQ5949386.1 diguanylate cyclase [Massilia sp. ST3]